MNVLFILHHRLDPTTGVGGTVLSLAQRYRDSGHEVSYCTFDTLPAGLSHNAKTLLWPSYLAARLPLLLARRGIDVIDTSLGDTWMWGGTARRLQRRPPAVVARSHGLQHIAHEAHLAEARAGRKRLSRRYPLYWGGFRLWETAASMRQADRVLLLNGDELAYATTRLRVPPKRARLQRNGVAEEFLEQPIEWARADGRGIGIAQVGYFRDMKGVHHSVRALNAVLARHPDAHAAFLGTDRPREQVLRGIDPGVRERVRVVPRYRRDELPELLRGYHVKLFPTMVEGFSLSLLESMACGLAPVASSAPGVREFVVDGENGLLVAPGDSQALETALERLIVDVDLLRRLQEGARESARPLGWNRVAAATLEIYQEALAERRDGRRR